MVQMLCNGGRSMNAVKCDICSGVSPWVLAAGPLYYKGWYHLFYQWNPDAAVWGNISWGHAVSRDLIHWLHLPLAMVPDHWYDINGVWTGSATQLPDGRIVMLYTGSTEDAVQVQLLAEP